VWPSLTDEEWTKVEIQLKDLILNDYGKKLPISTCEPNTSTSIVFVCDMSMVESLKECNGLQLSTTITNTLLKINHHQKYTNPKILIDRRSDSSNTVISLQLHLPQPLR
jgi:nanoRNase/pAp phosphatase (c-di-AMP/oligoRNAs hydrolase)